MTEETPQQLGDPERDAVIVKEVQQKIAALVTAANKLPRLGDEYELCASFKMFKAFMQQQEVRLQKLIAKCMETSGCPVVAPKAGSTTDVFLDRITRANDAIVERAGICMDEIQRSHRDDVVHVPKSIVGAESTKAASARQPRLPNATLATGLPAGGFQLMMQTVQQHKEQMRLSAVAISRPQKDYKIAVDNSRNAFVSKLRVKHHSREKPRGLRVVDLDSSNCQKDFDLEQEMQLEHPYRVELEHFQVPQRQLESAEPIAFEPLDKVTLTFVNTKIGLENLRDQLNKEKEFAVDLEHNNTRTFLGLTCLLQISTRTTDYIVDPFQVWDEMHILNEPFANPVILKVFHGADSDIQWLQRDFGIHVVNMFDTYHAMKHLEMPKFSLQWLVQNYCDIVLSKAYQTSDWRLRPLTQEQLDYARCDTHYLLYCYDRCREDLLKKGNEHQNLLRAVYGDSVVVCGRAYEKPQFDPLGFETLLHSKRTFNSQQVYALKELWMWRDNVARTEDEGLNYVLPAHMMMYIAEALPREAQGITACCNPVPEMVKKHVLDIHKLVYAARDQPLILGYAQKKNIIGEEGSFFRAMQDEENRMNKVKSVLRCALDFSHSRFDEEIGRISVQEEDDGIRTKAFQKSFFSFMDPKQADCAVNEARMEPKIQKKIQTELDDWATPFERYQIGVKKAAEAEEKKRLEEAKMKKEPTEEKKRYSHHDPVNRRPTNSQSINVNVDDIQLNNGPDEGPYTDSQVYTKKALARKRKHAKKAADIKFGAGGDARSEEPMEEGEQESDDEEPLVFTKEEGEDEGETTKKTKVEPVDYSQYEASMFNQKAKKSDTFDPFHQQARIERNKKGGRGGKRGRGGFHRMGKQSTGYKPQK